MAGKRTIWHEVRCDIHGKVDPMHHSKVVKVQAPGTGKPKGCPITGCPNNPNSETDTELYERESRY